MSCQALVDAKADIVMLAGFMMPKFGGQGMCGLNVHRAVLAAGDTPETLAERVQTRERVLVVEVLGDVARGRLRLPTS